jgi:PhzF family phenazine biosynthesis protein
MTMQRRFAQIDVFTAVPLMGNPVAVVLDGAGLSDAAMQRFANWTNLSETTFVLPATDPGADYALRIFTPKSELPFAGHPTLGSAHAVIAAGLATPRGGALVQECAVGLVAVRVAGEGALSFRLPPPQIDPAPAPEALIAALGAPPLGPPQVVNVGPRWVIAELATPAAVRGLTPDYAALAAYDRAHGTTGQTIFAREADGNAVVRSFAAADGITEDPVCGSGNGAVAAYRRWSGTGGANYRASQGREIGRDGVIDIRFADGEIYVGGRCVTVIEGMVRI